MTTRARRCRAAAAAFMVGAAALVVSATAQAAPLDVRVTDAAGKPVAGAVVFLESPEARAQVKPMTGAEVAQAAKQFAPQVSVVTVGTAVDFPNRDTVRHHVYSFSPVKRFEIKLYVGTPASPVVFDAPGIAVLGCNIHDNMAAWIVIVETPWFGRTDADGRWQSTHVPAGAYRLRTWHVNLAVGATPAEQALRVEPGGSAASVRLPGLAP